MSKEIWVALEGMVKKLEKRVRDLEEKLQDVPQKAKRREKPEQPSGCVQLKKAFLEGYARAFGHEYPRWGARENGQATQLLKSLSLEKAVWLVDWYLVWKDPYIVREAHPFGMFVSSIVKLEAQLQRKGRYFDDVAGANVGKRLMMEKREETMEVAYGSIRSREQRNGINNGSVQIGFGNVGRISEQADKKLPVVGDGHSSDGVQGNRDDSGCSKETA